MTGRSPVVDEAEGVISAPRWGRGGRHAKA